MCGTCGCADTRAVHGQELHDHHPHDHDDRPARTVALEQDVLAKNDALAVRNRAWLAERGIVAVNLMSSPGAGKTTLLERTVSDLSPDVPVAVVEGDQETALDSERVRAAGCPGRDSGRGGVVGVVQVNTGTGCHLDATMLHRALDELDPPPGSLVFVENVGNLVCPALFDLGESARAVIASATEGEDKPLKYPRMFRSADLLLLNKVDLLPHLDFDTERYAGYARRVNPAARLLAVSATRGHGLADWYGWLRARLPAPAPTP